MIHERKKKSAFTLIEVTIAIGIVMVGMLGVVSLMLQNLQAGGTDRDFLVASMLAQEGLELVRNQRDLNWLTGGAEWHSGLIGDGSYGIDYYPGDAGDLISITDFDGIDNARLQIDPYGFYAHNTGVNWASSSFYRLIEVDDSAFASGDGYLDVTCTVRFRRQGRTKNYVASTRLYPWRY